MTEAHENAEVMAHTGSAKSWSFLNKHFNWPQMKVDLVKFVATHNFCQKIKDDPMEKSGLLQPYSIPTHPFQVTSMGIIAGLPWSNGNNAILVVVCKLTKYTVFLTIDTRLTLEGLARLFVDQIISTLGILKTIVMDRDPQWMADFWKGIAKATHINMSLSSLHHLQHNEQTERVNWTLEVMLRAYIGKDKNDWTEWMLMLQSMYNLTPAKSTEGSPSLLLLRDRRSYWEEIQMHRKATRQVIVAAQDKQARHFNKKRTHQEFEIGEQVLAKPHRLEWENGMGLPMNHCERNKRGTDQFNPNFESTSKTPVYELRRVWLVCTCHDPAYSS